MPRNRLKESFELKNWKELRLPYPWWEAALIHLFRTVAYPRKYKPALYAVVLSLLPVASTLLGALSLREDAPDFDMCRFGELWHQGEAGRAFFIAFCLYILLVIVTLGMKLMTDKYTRSLLLPGAKADSAGYTKGISVLILVLLGLSSSLLSLEEVTPYVQLTGTFTLAILIGLISQGILPLLKEYRQAAGQDPPLFCERMWVVLMLALAVWSALLALALSFDRL